MTHLSRYISGYKSDGVPYITNEKCDEYGEFCNSIYRKNRNKHKNSDIDIVDFAEWLGLSFIYENLSCADILGGMSFHDGQYINIIDDETGNIRALNLRKGTMIINKSLECKEMQGRHNFTFAHECSHWLLHQSKFGNKMLSRKILCCRSELVENINQNKEQKFDIVEHQANRVASSILMPKNLFIERTYELFEEYGHRYNVILDGVEDSKEQLRAYASDLAEIFNVSIQAAEIRIQTAGLLNKYSEAKYL